MSSVTMTTAAATTSGSTSATAPLPRGLNVVERGRVLREAQAASLSLRERAGALTERALVGAPPTARSLVLELDHAHGLCVLGVGDRPAAVWRFDAGPLTAGAAGARAEASRLRALASLREEARRVILAMRLGALRGTIGDVVVVHDHPGAPSRLVGALLLEAIVEHVWIEEGDAGGLTRGSARGGAECRTA